MSIEKPNTKWVTAGLLLGLVLSSLDQTIVAAALPTITKQLGGFSLYSWVFTVYMLASTVMMPIYGKLADLFGRKRVFLGGLSLFLLGSLLCGCAHSMYELIAFRCIQGLGAGALMPVAFTIIADIYPPEQRVKFMGLFSTVFAASSIGGPVIGGLLAAWSWRWIFLMNLPIGLSAFLLLAAALKETQPLRSRPKIDWPGAAAFTGSVVALLLALVLGGNEYAWGSPAILGLWITGAVLLGVFIWVEAKAKEPMMPLRLFTLRTVTCSHIAGFFINAALFGAIAYIPLFVQGVIGVSAAVTGYILMPFMLATVVTTTGCRRWMMKVSYRTILVMSLSCTLVGFLLFSHMDMDTTKLEIVMYMLIAGFGVGAVFPALGTAAQHAVEWSLRGAATSSNQFFRSVGGTIGVSIMGGMLSRGIADRLEASKAAGLDIQGLSDPEMVLNGQLRLQLPEGALLEVQKAFSGALHDVFLLASLLVAASLLASAAMGKARLISRNGESS